MMRTVPKFPTFLSTWLVLLPISALTHHSPNVHFDRSETIEIEGELTEIYWRNPHVQLTVETSDAQGVIESWEIEYLAPSFLMRQGIPADLFRIGDTLRIAGFIGRANKAAIFTTNILFPNGQEVFDFQIARARWTENTVGVTFGEYQQEKLQEAPEISSSLFRVWSTDVANINPGRTFWKDDYPLTVQARADQASWDRVGENPYMRCENGMPAIMDQFFPTEFVLEDNEILVYLEEQDVVRTIHMVEVPEPTESSAYGHSVGYWEGDTLVVTTTHINWPWFDQRGIRQTENVYVVERFTPSANGHLLNYAATVTDPAIFTEPVVLERHWIWVPGESVEPYNCTVTHERY
ncbi:MAG: DUF6152 family protein [Pseudomonadota bacterium]|nr:DUF6152 family protein [Pseudomonadota bacterium]